MSTSFQQTSSDARPAKSDSHRWRKLRRLILFAACISLSVFVAASWYAAGALTASANHPVGPPPSGYDFESVSIASESGSDIAGWYSPADGAAATVILLHPIRTDRRAMLGRARLLREAGYALLLIDLQAHGESPGERITAGYVERHDVAAAVEFARTRNPNHRIGIVGWSLGGAAALMASPLNVDAMVLESVYPTVKEAVNNRISMRLGFLSQILTPALLVQLKPRIGISPSQLCPIDHIRDAACPVLIASGDRDQRTTFPETQRLYDRANGSKQLVVFKGAAHQDLLEYDNKKYEEIIQFLQMHLGRNEMENPS